MKSKELKVYNLPLNFKPLVIIDAKPHLLLLAIALFGVILCFIKTMLPYGIFIMALSICFLLFMPRLIMLEFYDDYLVMHNKANKSECVLVYYEDIVSWYYTRNPNKDYLYIELEDGRVEKIEAFSKQTFESAMNRFVKDKRRKNIK
ncbi:MAG: hypothetical protein Q4E33_04510 [Erysipelotrichaceae bacterium]|nr:hypothetical protein [Erysipelotrichaceae bacterium]